MIGEGYSLSMSLGANSDEERTSELVKKIIPVAEVKSNASGELIFALPASDSKSFGELFEALERNKVELDIGNFGLSITTMEDVFIRYQKIKFRKFAKRLFYFLKKNSSYFLF